MAAKLSGRAFFEKKANNPDDLQDEQLVADEEAEELEDYEVEVDEDDEDY